MAELLHRLTGALIVGNPQEPLSSRLCHAYRELSGAEGAALTVSYESVNRVTLCTTNEVARRLEDLQDVLGEGPGHSAAISGHPEVCSVPATSSSRWSIFVESAQDVVDAVRIHAVPMHPERDVFGVLTLYDSDHPGEPLPLAQTHLQFLANVVGAALIGDSDATGVAVTGPWASRAKIHQATGMVLAQMHLSPDDALAVLRAHAYGQQTTLSAIASAMVERRIKFPNP